MADSTIGAMRFQRRSAALRAEPVALSQAKPAAAIAGADEIASALRLKALMDGIDAAGGKITVEFPEGSEQ